MGLTVNGIRGLRAWRRGLTAALAGVLLAACGGSASGQSAGGTPTLNWYIFHDVSGSFPADAAACSASSGGRYNIQIRELPSSANGQREQLVRRSAAKDSSLDILGLDVTWEAEFSEAGWIVPWTGARRAQVEQDAVKANLDTATWKGQLVAAPFNSNTQLLWYRKDLVPHPPTTWAEMISQAEALARQGVILGPPAAKGVSLIGQLARSPAADPSLGVQMEDQNRLAFETGKAAFEINYPFVYPSAQENAPAIAKQMAWAEYPRVDANMASRPPVGGIDLAVSAFSRHKQQAFDAIQCLRDRDNQLRNAVKGGLPPTLASLYLDPRLIKDAYPFAAEILDSLQRGGVRPKTPAYQSVSIALQTTLSPPSSAGPAKLGQLRSQLQDAIESKGLIS